MLEQMGKTLLDGAIIELIHLLSLNITLHVPAGLSTVQRHAKEQMQ